MKRKRRATGARKGHPCPRIGLALAMLTACQALLAPTAVHGQTGGFEARVARQLGESRYGVLNNSIANLLAYGDTLWVGPYLNLTTDGGGTWQYAETDSLFGSENRVFSLDAEGDVIVAGLGRNLASGGQSVQTAAGFLVSEDGGESFAYRFPQLDQPTDTTVVYGVSVLGSLAVIVPQQSPPFDIDFDAGRNEIWVAGWASGIRRSDDMGRTWKRVVLPPDALDYIHPDSAYSFRLEPQRGSSGSLNHMGFGVLIDAAGAIWAGTAGGVNLSLDGGASWRRFKADGTARSLTGNWVVSIEEQPDPVDPVVWMATWNTSEIAGERFGVTYTADQGATFQQALHGERIHDFAFDGETVYAAGENGLFVSRDGGAYWTSIREFMDQDRPERIVRPGSSIFSVEYSEGTLWVGTSDGLLKSADGGATWTIFRTDVPLHPEEPTDEAPDVETYAYPNPFSPAGDRFIRIRYEVESQRSVTVRVFDFGMNLVRSLRTDGGSGVNEVSWDGVDDRGVRVANGAYFYEVDSGADKYRGKILVIE